MTNATKHTFQVLTFRNQFFTDFLVATRRDRVWPMAGDGGDVGRRAAGDDKTIGLDMTRYCNNLPGKNIGFMLLIPFS